MPRPYTQLDVYRVSDNKRVAVLTPQADGISKCFMDEALNGQLELTFEIPTNNTKIQYLNNANYVIRLSTDYEFVAVTVEDGRTNNNTTTMKIKYAGSFIELGQSFNGIVLDFRHRGVPYDGLVTLLDGSGWTVGVVDVAPVERRIITELESRLAILRKFQELYGGDLHFDTVNRVVHLRQRIGQDQNIHVRYRKNLLQVARTTDLKVITRLYPFGEGGDSHTRHNISEVNGGLLYVENFSYTSRVLEGIYVNTDFDDPSDLKAKAEDVLAYMCQPRVSYECDFVDLSRLAGYEIEFIGLGDNVRVFDEDLQYDFSVRVVRKKWNIFVPEKAELELSNARPDIATDFSKFIQAGKVVDQTVNPGGYIPSGFLQGFINTATNSIKSANSRLRWDDGDLICEEIDPATQEPTGRIVRINSGGIGISNDSGLTFTTAMTGAGIIADVITSGLLNAGRVNIVNDANTMKIGGNGIEIWDIGMSPARKRVHLGEYAAGTYGLQIVARDGTTALIDERGLLQTWQIQDADNVDSTHGLQLKTYIPGDTASIRRAYLNFSLEKFRAYNTGAASGGGSSVSSSSGGGTTATSSSGGGTSTTPTSSSGGGTVSTSADGVWNLSHWLWPDAMDMSGSHSHGGATGSAGNHNHGISPGTALAVTSNGTSVTGYVTWLDVANHTHSISVDGSHAHGMYVYHTHTVNVPNHSHTITVTIPDHAHTVNIPNHTHTVDIPSHTHAIIYGIYESTKATGVRVVINGVDRTTDLGGSVGGFVTDKTQLDITNYLAVGNWNTIELTSTALGRINAVLFIQAFMQVL